VAEYHLTPKLPKELKDKLPSERQSFATIKRAITESFHHAYVRHEERARMASHKIFPSPFVDFIGIAL